MMSWATLSVFIPTFLFVSLTPGMCMTLAMVLGMTQGVKRTLWMMVGELIGVGFVAAAAGAGVAALMLRQPELFIAFKWVGGA
ncbi:MAG: LysE family translocator, partial [Pseudomonadota bacterium]|nr:LysE family translocator [Pseudomonadota bacterium]